MKGINPNNVYKGEFYNMWQKYFIDDQETDYSVSTEGEVRKDKANYILT